MDDQVIRLQLQTLGTEGLAKLRAESASTKAAMESLGNEFKAGQVSFDDYSKQFGKLANSLENSEGLTKRLEATQAAVAREAAAAAAAIDQQAKAQAAAVASANDLLQRLTLSADAMQADQRAAIEAAAAKRAQSNAAAGVAREEQHLSQVIRAGILDMMTEEKATEGATAALRTHTTVAAAAGRATAGASSKMAGLGMATRETGRIIQDVVQGGIGGGINNLELFAMSLGAGPGIAGALTLVGTAALVATPAIKEWYASLTGQQNAIPEAADSIARIDDNLKKVNKQLDDYREKQSLTNKELIDYNRLSREQVELERAKADELERKKQLESITGIQGKAESEAAAGFREAVANAGGGEDAQRKLRQSLENSGLDAGEAAAKADELFREASQGIKSSIAEIRDAIRDNLPKGQSGLAKAIEESSPEAKERAKADDKRADLAALLKHSGASDDFIRQTMERFKGSTAKELAEVIEDTRRINQEHADADREKGKADNAAKTTFNKGVSDTKALGAIDDAKAEAKLDLVDDKTREQATAAARARVRAAIEEADQIPKAIRDAVADEVAKDIVNGIGNAEVARARAAGDTRANRDAAKADRDAKAKAAKDRARTDAERKAGEGLADRFSAASDVDERAAAIAGQAAADGGYLNRQGREVRFKSPADLQAYVRKQVFAMLRQKGANPQDAELAAGTIAGRATGQALGQAAANTGDLLGLAAQTNQQVSALDRITKQQGQAIKQLARQARVNSRSIQRQGR